MEDKNERKKEKENMGLRVISVSHPKTLLCSG